MAASFLPFDITGPERLFRTLSIRPSLQTVLRPFLWSSPQFNAHKLAGCRVVARAESALLLNNDHRAALKTNPPGVNRRAGWPAGETPESGIKSRCISMLQTRYCRSLP